MLEWLKKFSQNSSEGTKSLPSVYDLKDLQGKTVLLRSSLNVPIKDGKVQETFRIEQSLLTINHLKERGAKVIVLGHIGRDPNETLKPVFEILEKETSASWYDGEVREFATSSFPESGVVLFENVRRDNREKDNDSSLAGELAALADIYVNDAFPDSHREHASIVGIPKLLPSYFGINFLKEYEALRLALTPESPSLFILGGAKFETKLPLLEKLATKYDEVLIAGALANDMLKANGYEIGRSLTSQIDLTKTGIIKLDNLIVPVDVVVEDASGSKTVMADEIEKDQRIVDIGPETLRRLTPKLNAAKSILWNGTLGNYENGFAEATEHLAEMIAAAPGHSIVGGGDTVASIRELNLSDKFSFLSSAGGAMLTFLETGTLPAIDAVLKR